MVVGERMLIEVKDDSRPVCGGWGDREDGGGGTGGRGFCTGSWGGEVIVRRFCVSSWDTKVPRSTRRPETNDLTLFERDDPSSVSSL
jgi:hypothetical protein